MDCRHRGVLSLTILERNGGHHRSHILLLWAGKEAALVHNAWFVCNVRCFDDQHTEFPGQLVGKQAGEEGVVLLSPGAEAQVKSSDGFREAAG
jgi:hypothetical protein